MRIPNLQRMVADAGLTALRLFSDRQEQLSQARVQAVSRSHRPLLELIPGGAPRYLPALQARNCSPGYAPATWPDASADSWPPN